MTSDANGKRWRAWIAGGVLLSGAAVAAWWTGSHPPGVPRLAGLLLSKPQAPHAMGGGRIDDIVEALAQRLKSRPDDAQGWAMLARSYASMGRHGDALPAYAKAVALQPGDPALLADYADELALQQGRRLGGEPIAWVKRALAIDPDQPKALLLAGTEAFDRGDRAQAVRQWTRVLQVAPPASELVQQAHAGLMRARERPVAAK